MAKQPNIFLVGPMGAGKSSIGKAVAQRLQCTFYDSDTELEERAGTSISWIFDVEGEEGMRQREMKVINDLTKKQNIVLATGGGSIIKPENRNALAGRGTVFYLKASIEQQVARTKKNRGHRPLLQVEDPKARIMELQEIREPLYTEISDYMIDTNDRSITLIAQKIIDCIS